MENGYHKSNLSASAIDQETDKKLKGDAIGNTLYSQSGILKTLLQLSDMKWSEELEDELCFLWDSTTEKDVCEFLYNHKFPALVRSLVEEHHDNSRFVEIMIGTLGNMLLALRAEREIDKEEILTIVSVLHKTADPLILIQVVRVMTALAYLDIINLDEYYTDEINSQLNFILENSNNSDLLQMTMDFFVKIGLSLKEKYVTSDFIQNLVTAFKTIIENVNSIQSGPGKLAVTSLIQIVSNCCGFIKDSDEKRKEFLPGIETFLKEANKILKCYRDLEEELYLDDATLFHFNGIAFVVLEMDIAYSKNLFLNTCRLIELIAKENRDFEEFLKMIAFFVYKGDFQEIKDDLDGAKAKGKFNPVPVLSLLHKRSQNKESFCDFLFQDNFERLMEVYHVKK